MPQSDQKPTRKERKKARKELAALLKRLQRGCAHVDRLSEWYDMARDVETIVAENSRAIPAVQRQRILRALRLPEQTLGAAVNACRLLQGELGKTIAGLGGTSILGGALITVVVLAAAAVLIGGITATITAVDVRVFNVGCGPLNAADVSEADSAWLSLLGLDLPPAAIASGGDALLSLPPLQFTADNRADGDLLTIYGPGQIRLFSIPVGSAADILFNGDSLLGRRRTINLSDVPDGGEHILEVICGG